MELVDTQDLKSCGQQCPYGFDSRPKHRAEAGRKASWFPVRLSSLYPTYPSRSIYLQSNRLNLIAVAAVTVVDMVVRSWLLRTWLLRLNHTISSYHHIIPPCHTELRPHTFIAVHIAALIAAIKVGCVTLLCIPRPSSRLGRLPRGFPVVPLRRFPVALCSAM